MNNKLKKRNEIPEKYKWDLEAMYANNDLWEEDFKRLSEMAEQIQKYKENITSSAQNLLECLELDDKISRLSRKVHRYAYMRSDEDTTNAYYQALSDRANTLLIQMISQTSFIKPAILDTTQETIQSFMQENEKLKLYKFYLEKIMRQKEHVLSQQEEKIISMASEIMRTSNDVYKMINNADIKFSTVIGENNEEIQLTRGNYTQLIVSKDRNVRKQAFEKRYETYAKQKNTLAVTLASRIKANIFESKVRNYPSCLAKSVFAENIDIAVYDNLIKTIHNNVHLIHRDIKLRKKMLKLEELHMYDLYAPLIEDVDKKITYEQAVETIKEALKPLGEQYAKDLEHGFNSRWIDVCENEGKKVDGYSSGCYDSKPYVFLNYKENLEGMFTIVHEMGHSVHSFYSRHKQPYIYSYYSLFVAEVVSAVNETLLIKYLLNKATDKKEIMYLIDYFIAKFRTTVYRQTMVAEFEKITHEKAENGESLTAESLCSIYHDLNVKYFGEDIIVDEQIDMDWARMYQLYTSFYAYKYATGLSAAVALAEQILTEGQPAVDRYLEFLSSGDSDYSLNLLKKAGVDMTTTEPVEKALKVFEELLDKMESMID